MTCGSLRASTRADFEMMENNPVVPWTRSGQATQRTFLAAITMAAMRRIVFQGVRVDEDDGACGCDLVGNVLGVADLPAGG